MHDFNPGDGATRCPKRLEVQHGMRNAFDRSMVLLHEVIEIFGVANDDGPLVDLIVVRDRGGVATTSVDRDFLRQPLPANGFV